MSPDTGHQDEPIGLPGIDLAPTVLIDLRAWLDRKPADRPPEPQPTLAPAKVG